MIVLLLIAAVLVLLGIGLPVAFALLLPCLIYVVASPDISLGVAMQRMVAGVNSFPLLAVPLFIMTGYVANRSGMAERLFRLLQAWLGHLPGALGYVNVGSSLLFSWMSGAAVADAAGLGSVLVPAMRRAGYRQDFSLGLTASSSMIGPLMPPSIPAIIYAVTAGTSVGGLFLAGVVPALLLTFSLMLAVGWHVRRHGPRRDQVDPAELPPSRRAATLAALPVLGTPLIILGGILGGLFTPTEAAAAAVLYLLLLSCLYRSLSWQDFRQLGLETAATAGSILLIVSAASLFGWVIAREQVPQLLADQLLNITDNRLVFLLLVNALLLAVGMLIEPTAALLICVPVLLPAASQYGIDPLHLGVLMILNLVIGLITPPIGLVLFVLSSVTHSPMTSVIRGTLPFLVPLGTVLLMVTLLEGLSLWLPRLFGL